METPGCCKQGLVLIQSFVCLFRLLLSRAAAGVFCTLGVSTAVCIGGDVA